jgi:endonuclease/exonuclease/phosphatase family metal-dependent hydrolase
MQKIARDTLPTYTEVEKYKYVTDNDDFPQATYLKRTIPLLASGAIMENEEGVGLGLYVQIRVGDKNLYICNFHGMSRPVDKLDHPEKLRQSQRLIDFFGDREGLKIIGGDFNLLPETKSIQMFRENGYKDLIKEYKIATTRNRLAWEMYPNHKLYYSDYVFVSPDVKVKSFSVPNIEISDHLPLILEIE